MARALRPTPALAAPLLLLLAGCGAAPAGESADPLAARDPVVARALHDPLMSDPDLAARNSANALIGLADESALPLLAATPEAARAAREAGRLELLAGGAIPALPPPDPAAAPLPAPEAGTAARLAALGAPAGCAAAIEQGFGWAANLPPVAAIMPHGMVVEAGGARAPDCDIRIIRYRTPASAEDVLQYHHALGLRAGLAATYRAEPPAGIAARGAGGEALVVSVGPALSGGLTAVTLLYRAPGARR